MYNVLQFVIQKLDMWNTQSRPMYRLQLLSLSILT